MKIKNFITMVTVMVTFLACGTYDDDGDFNAIPDGSNNVDKCLNFGEAQLELTIQDKYTTLPGKVSVFFKVNDLQGNPVPGLTANNFTIYEQGRNDDCFNTISSSESQARISPNTQIFNNNTLLVLDLSNSVLSTSLQELKEASISFVNSVMPASPSENFKMAIYWFDGEDELHLLNDLTADAGQLVSSIEGITSDISNDPSTDLYGAVIKSTNKAEDLINEYEGQSIISAASVVIFTDGTDQASRYTESDALKKVNNADENVSYFTIGLGGEIDEEVLKSIGKTSSAFAGNKEELVTTFNEISVKVSGQANSYYLFEYCSPKRDGSGTNNLVIQARSGTMQGAVQTKFDATGFTGGCE
ncbi:von Willebrand factor type A domain-containing protein [Zhouia amylolytica]|uniref:von willebrand factor A n=2 Tax=Zhouia amylolytica TaxID=376730 RepID=W2UP13_9FLAO|nr:VWA domain-containing protein [Zhouia amylolytica]ETN95900.1 von willebrand factor A [Zhouia amylolytica AD3]MCQ0111975.1 VWA domain-containing protein [Zhouia amylolytica]SFS53677.1 von Willebrand factor type A domain-containing protein [Zhouia amylolytica]